MNIHNPALAEQLARVRAARARMGINTYSPLVRIPKPQPAVVCHEPAADETQANLCVADEAQLEPENEILVAIARRQKVRPIIHACAAYFDVEAFHIVSSRRTPEVVKARHIGMYMAVELTPLSYLEIAGRFGKSDHTTVLYAHRKIAMKVANGDAETLAAIEAIKQTARVTK